jgi:alcohol dehydrogenase class IV
MPAVLKFNESAIRDRFDTVADYFSIGGGFVGFCAYVDGLNASLQIPRNLTQLGVGQDRLDELVEMALNDPSCGGNPIELNVKNTREILDNALN